MFMKHAELKAKVKLPTNQPGRLEYKNKLYIIIIIHHYFYWVVNQIMLRTCERKHVLFEGKNQIVTALDLNIRL